ncbi:MAG: TrbC/VirB2 family protein [Myxococcales bacterium]|nr:TrbC/VirB2 family protein [Myxococcales bacterium]
MHKYSAISITLLVALAFPSLTLAAAATGMPYEAPLNTILDSIAGPVARVIGGVAIILFGLGLAFSESGGVARKALAVLLGLTIAFNALTWGLGFFGFAAGLVV